MKIKKLKLKNFRGFCDEIEVDFDNLTAFVGKNDVGKSTILEALDIFFNDGKGAVKLDKNDISIPAGTNVSSEISISVCFDELPERVIIDSANETTLEEEFLVNSDGLLEIIKKYPNAGTSKVFVRAHHPTNPSCSDLLLKKDSELRKQLEENQIECTDKTRNAIMRKTIWSHYGNDLRLADVELDISKGDAKSIWEKLQSYLPLYVLFQSDRKNSDGDSEIQDPLKEAVKEILADEKLRHSLNEVALAVENKLKEVSSRTLEKLKEMSPEVANTLNPVIPDPLSLKWADVFKNVSICSDENIPINKRGSGVKRLVLLNFFRAQAERRKEEAGSVNVIYALEEPETSQHFENQRKLVLAFRQLSKLKDTQVLFTTHSATIVKELDFENVRLVLHEGGCRIIQKINENHLPYPSLNEVNYLAFSEATEEYHNELYGYIEAQGLLTGYRKGKELVEYIKDGQGKKSIPMRIIKSEYIRHQIHHPENALNRRFAASELYESIENMRSFILDTRMQEVEG